MLGSNRETHLMNNRQPLALSLTAVLILFLVPACSQRVVVKQKIGAFTGKQVDLAETRIVWERIQSGTATPEDIKAYNQAVDDVVVKLAGKSMPKPGQKTITLNSLRNKVIVDLDPGTKGDLDLRNHEHMYVSDLTLIKRGLNRIVSDDGVGASLALCTPASESDPFIAPEGLWQPATAILEFNGEPDRAKLVIYDPAVRQKISVNGHPTALATDYSIPLATGFALRDKQLFHLPAMLHYAKFEGKLGLIRLTPFDAGKIPCILVHGLKSSPATWKEALNKILANPALRERFEFWSYGYPTGAPIPYSAMRLRREIAAMHQFRTAQGGSDDDLLVVGHSMGGLLAKGLLQTSGNSNWDQIFTQPLETLGLSESNETVLRDMMYFEPVPSISRVVFMATPHRGSGFATNPFSGLISKLIDLPQQIVNVSTELVNIGRTSLTPLGLEIAANPPTSIDGLRPDSPMLLLMDSMPLKPDVICHSIVAIERGFDQPQKKWSDGVVPYSSSIMDAAESQIVIPRTKHSVHQSEAGIAELERILSIHIGVPVPDDVTEILSQVETPKSISTNE